MFSSLPVEHASGLVRTLHGEQAKRPPIWLMRQAGRYLPEYREVRARAGSFLNLCYDPVNACEVTLQPIRRFGLDAAIIFCDILVVPHALGQALDFREGEGPVLEPVTDGTGIAGLKPDGLTERLTPVYEAISRTRAALPDGTALIGFCGAPWTVATYMVGGRGSPDQADTRKLAYRDPQTMQRLIDILVEASAAHLIAQIEAGAEAVQIFDSWAGSLPDDQFARWCVAPMRAIADRVRAAHPDVPIIGFPRGADALAANYAAEAGADAIGCGTAMPLETMAGLQTRLPVQGNLDPLLLVAGGDAMRRRVDRILEALADGPFVFNLGHGIVPETPPDHVAELVARVQGRT